MRKLIYIVLDGAADGINGSTSLEEAYTPNLDEIARISRGGMHYPIGKGHAPESDSAVISLLGYDYERYYVGRGPIEALGVGLDMDYDHEVAFRGNLATIDPNRKIIIDRRVGRDISTDEAKNLLKGVSFVNLGIYEGYAKIKVGLDYRVAVVIGSKKYKLSSEVSNTDPAYIKIGNVSVAKAVTDNKLVQCKPLSNSSSAKITAELVNRFTEIIQDYLINHPINKRRVKKGRLPANTVLLRDAGMKPKNVPSMKSVYKLKFKMIADMPTEIGIAKLLKIGIVRCPKLTHNSEFDYTIRVKKVCGALPFSDAIYVHLKGPDIYGHDGDKEGKIKSIEEIDRYFISKLLDNINLDEVALLITMDHTTPPSKRTHTGDPVPFIIYASNIGKDGFSKFYEREIFMKGTLGILGYGWMILPIIKKLLWG